MIVLLEDCGEIRLRHVVEGVVAKGNLAVAGWEPGNEQRCLDKSFKPSEVLPEFYKGYADVAPWKARDQQRREEILDILQRFTSVTTTMAVTTPAVCSGRSEQ